jgi:hypothetical protein
MSAMVLPFPPKFPALLKDYCEQIGEAVRANKHHDTRRHLLLNFLREAFGVDPVEVELEHKLKAGELRGRIDALYRHVIVEVKTDFDNERDDAQRELKKYFASRPRPTEYIGIVTDGSRCEAWHLNRNKELVSISEIEIRADDPLVAWRWLDQFLSSGIRRVPTSDELVCRFGVQTLQPQGLMGERDIHRRPFEACNIPLFDPKNELHRQIAEVSAAARAELLPIVPKMQLPVAGARAAARDLVAGKLNRLNELTIKLLKAQPARPKNLKHDKSESLELFEG